MLVDKRIVDRFLPTVSHSEQKDHNVLLNPSWNTVPINFSSLPLSCKNATRSAVHESGATPSLTTSRHLLSTPQTSLCRPIYRFPPNVAFLEAIF